MQALNQNEIEILVIDDEYLNCKENEEEKEKDKFRI